MRITDLFLDNRQPWDTLRLDPPWFFGIRPRRPFSGAPAFVCHHVLVTRTRVYVDGFNLYYGALRGTRFKWLDVSTLLGRLLPNHRIDHITYCTARVTGRAHDPGQPVRQDVYLRALRTIPNLTVVEGAFLTQEKSMPLVAPGSGGQRFARVIKTEEKGSDVNLASSMLRDGFLGLFDVAVLVSNDSDLALPLKIVRNDIGKTVGILNPHKRASKELNLHRDFYKPIRKGVLAASQFPLRFRDAIGLIEKPSEW